MPSKPKMIDRPMAISTYSPPSTKPVGDLRQDQIEHVLQPFENATLFQAIHQAGGMWQPVCS